MLRAVLFKSDERFNSFSNKLAEYGVSYTILDFDNHDWIDFDYSSVDFLIYYPTFKYSSNHPLSLIEVRDNLTFIKRTYPDLMMYPDINIIDYYNDKYKQFLFLKKNNFPTPLTYSLFSEESLKLAHSNLGYPMVIKNRYGAGGNSVFIINSERELENFYKLSTFNFFNLVFAKHLAALLSKRIFYYHTIKMKRMPYPFLSPPLLAQKFLKIDRDLKTVVGNYKVVEGHWRIQADKNMWKMNIDGGGIGEWSNIPPEAIDLSEKLARELNARWINLDIIASEGRYFITEFSPIWHHYKYKEKSSFVYKDDYNIDFLLKFHSIWKELSSNR